MSTAMIYWRRRRQKHCSTCGRPALRGRGRCARCRTANNTHLVTRYARLKAAGQCVQCGEEAARPFHARCARCLAYQLAHRPQKAAGRTGQSGANEEAAHELA